MSFKTFVSFVLLYLNFDCFASLKTKLLLVLNISTITFLVTTGKPTGCFFELQGAFWGFFFSKIYNFGPMKGCY
jgi:hypothetical protein